jgi:hypothetical protein
MDFERNRETATRLAQVTSQLNASLASLNQKQSTWNEIHNKAINTYWEKYWQCWHVANNANNQSVRIFEHCSYQGWGVDFKAGARMSEPWWWWGWGRGWFWNNISSIRIPSSLKVTIYDRPDYRGNSTVLTSDNWCLLWANGQNFNDRVKSFIVEARTRWPTWEGMRQVTHDRRPWL